MPLGRQLLQGGVESEYGQQSCLQSDHLELLVSGIYLLVATIKVTVAEPVNVRL
jgi:hypothetical protein